MIIIQINLLLPICSKISLSHPARIVLFQQSLLPSVFFPTFRAWWDVFVDLKERKVAYLIESRIDISTAGQPKGEACVVLGALVLAFLP